MEQFEEHCAISSLKVSRMCPKMWFMFQRNLHELLRKMCILQWVGEFFNYLDSFSGNICDVQVEIVCTRIEVSFLSSGFRHSPTAKHSACILGMYSWILSTIQDNADKRDHQNQQIWLTGKHSNNQFKTSPFSSSSMEGKIKSREQNTNDEGYDQEGNN